MKLPSEIHGEVTRLTTMKAELARSLLQLGTLHDTVFKDTIFNTLNNFIDSLHYIKSQIEFEFGVTLSEPIRNNDVELIDLALKYGELADFLNNFKKNIVSKQLELKGNELSTFKEEKRAKFHITQRTEDETDEKDDVGEIENMTTDAKVMATTKTITSRLVQSSQLLQTTLMQSHLNLEELDQQGDDLSRLADSYTFIGTLLEKSDVMVRDIKLSKERDRRIMYACFAFFGLCCAWVLWCRVLKWPVKLTLGLMYMLLRPVFYLLGFVGKSKEVDFIEDKFSESLSMTASLETPLTVFKDDTEALEVSLKTITTVIDGVETTIVDIETETVGDEFDDALGRIIDEL